MWLELCMSFKCLAIVMNWEGRQFLLAALADDGAAALLYGVMEWCLPAVLVDGCYSCFTISSPDCTLHTAITHVITVLNGGVSCEFQFMSYSTSLHQSNTVISNPVSDGIFIVFFFQGNTLLCNLPPIFHRPPNPCMLVSTSLLHTNIKSCISENGRRFCGLLWHKVC